MEDTTEATVASPPRSRSWFVVDLPEELDVASMPALRQRLTTLILSGRVRLVLNAAPLDFVDATGIGALVYAANLARARGGWIRLIGVKQKHMRLLMILRLGRMLPIHEDLRDALREA